MNEWMHWETALVEVEEMDWGRGETRNRGESRKLFSPSSNIGSSPSSLTTPPRKMQSCWWINSPTSFCLFMTVHKSFLSLSLPLCKPAILAWATQIHGNEPLQPTLVVHMWIKCVNAKSQALPGTFQAAFLTRLPQLLPPPVQCTFKKK